MNEENQQKLIPAHGWQAARELIADLRSVPELAAYVYPDVWQQKDQAKDILTKTRNAKLCIVVGMAENRLAFPAADSQGARVWLGLAVYLFTPQRANTSLTEEMQQSVCLTLLSHLNGWRYTAHKGQPIRARLDDMDTVDLSTLTSMQGEVTADVVRLEIPVGLTRS